MTVMPNRIDDGTNPYNNYSASLYHDNFCQFWTLDLQLSFYRPLCYNRAHCPLLLCLRTTSAILSGAYSYFVVLSFKCEGTNSCHDLIPNPRKYGYVTLLKRTFAFLKY